MLVQHLGPIIAHHNILCQMILQNNIYCVFIHFRSKIFDKTIFAFLKKYVYYKNINFVKFFCKTFFDKTSQIFAKSFSFLNILLIFLLNILKNLLEKCKRHANFVKREYIQSSTLMLTGEKRRRI